MARRQTEISEFIETAMKEEVINFSQFKAMSKEKANTIYLCVTNLDF